MTNLTFHSQDLGYEYDIKEIKLLLNTDEAEGASQEWGGFCWRPVESSWFRKQNCSDWLQLPFY